VEGFGTSDDADLHARCISQFVIITAFRVRGVA